MNNLETRRNKINSCMAELFNLYMEDRKTIKGSIILDGVKCTLTFGETSNEQVVDKKVMTIDDLRYIVINCITENEAKNCCELAYKLGWKWCDGEKYYYNGFFGDYKRETCFNFYEGQRGGVRYFESRGYTQKSYQWFFDNFTPKE